MKALTLHQPWASAIAEGIKAVETRSWATSYRGPLAIHAGKRMPASWTTIGSYRVKGFGRTGLALIGPGLPEFRSVPRLEGCLMPLGAIVATANLVDVVPIGPESYTGDDDFVHVVEFNGEPVVRVVHHDAEGRRCTDYRDEASWGDFTPGRFAWLLDGVRKLDEPIPAKGRQGLWEWTD
jgi:hypothetical protein